MKGPASLRRWAEVADFEIDMKGQFRSSSHSMGYAIFQWLRLRCGMPTFKPDLHVLRFVETAIGRRPSPYETVGALVEVAGLLKLETHRLDAAIWQYQKDQ